MTLRSPSGASATVRRVRRSSYRRGRLRSASWTVARPLLRSFSWMAGPTPRRRSTVVSKGSGVRPALAAAVAIAARRDFGGEGEGEGKGEGEGEWKGGGECEGECEGEG